jgi:hypothetical protein
VLKSAEIGPDWPGLAEIGPDWLACAEIGRDIFREELF